MYFHLRNAFENVVCETVSILFRPQCVNDIQDPGKKDKWLAWY